jgi:cell division transport system ATP-binding protein
MIKFENVSKKFGSIAALDDVSFEIGEGEFVFLTGPSGAGKTTIVKLILKEFLPTEGKILVNDQDVSKIKNPKICDYRRGMGVVFQDFKLLPDRTVFENVALPLEIRKKSLIEINKAVEETLKSVGLLERRDLFPSQLAGGELQRASLARAIINDPKILLCDEPTGNLDPKTSWQLIELIKKVNQKGVTIIMATHNVNIVDSLKERVLELDGGKLVRDQRGASYESAVVKVEAEEKDEKKKTKKGK